MKQIYGFLQELAQNNNREWFAGNKHIYKLVQAKFHTLAQQLIDAVSLWDPDIAASNLSVNDCTYRIYRDTRFSRSKEPYKIHMGIFICKGGKKSPYAGYYFHLEPEYFLPDNPLHSAYCKTPLSLGKCALIAGTYRFENPILRSIRDEISVNGDSFLDAIAAAEGFSLMEGEMLKRVPAEFASAPEKWHNLLKQKEFAVGKWLDLDYVFAPDLAARISGDFRKTADFVHKINMAVDYALENM
ncbi:MAG: DUF2461 domain-containing protein [Bacteroidales bacterium]|nr:DUF2461 domain-containing protein [Bacteroidales bacterium]